MKRTAEEDRLLDAHSKALGAYAKAEAVSRERQGEGDGVSRRYDAPTAAEQAEIDRLLVPVKAALADLDDFYSRG